MAASEKDDLNKNSAKSAVLSSGDSGKARAPEKRSDSLLLSPLTLMVLGMAGAATAAMSSDQPANVPAADSGAEPITADAPLATDVVLAASDADAAGNVEKLMESLVQNMLAEGASAARVPMTLDLAQAFAASDTVATDDASTDEPIRLALAEFDSGSVIVAQASTPATAEVAPAQAVAPVATAEAASGGLSLSTIGAGIAGLAIIGAAASSKSTPDTTAPAEIGRAHV